MGGHIEMMFVPGKAYPRFATYKPYERVSEMVPAVSDEAIQYAREIQGHDRMSIRPDFISLNNVSPDQRTSEWPEGVPNINPPRPPMARRTFSTTSSAAAGPLGSIGAAGLARAAAPATPIDFKSNLPAPGSFPDRWICGSPSSMDNTDPPAQGHWYNPHTAISPQNKAYRYEAPFAPLYFGNDRVSSLDEGFVQLRNDWDLRGVVDGCIADWCKRNGRDPASSELSVAFSHSHADHYAATNQFADRPNTRYMGSTQEEMMGFWGMTNFPEERVTSDSGGRDISIWGSPGHVMSEFAHYDTYTQILYTGDTFYRGRCYISFWQPWFDSMKRSIDFCDTHPVSHVMGC
ncbi:hypothetical protein OY671_007882, partial [Metschnikowia pulcherrima]